MFFGVEHFGKDMWVRLFAGQASPSELRCCSGMFALMPWMIVVFQFIGPYFFITDKSFGFVLFTACVLLASFIWLWVWVSFIPTKFSWVLGTLFWLALIGWSIASFF